jgi:hypothetical protein
MDTYYPLAAFGDLSNMVYDHLLRRCREHFAATAAEKAAITTVAQAEERKARMRAAFLRAIGGLPEAGGDLQPVWGELRARTGYSVQNVLFQAAPRVYVTATVWRPLGWDGPRPGVLFPCGHHEAPRAVAEYQNVCRWFACNGYVTLAYDPPGQGERKLCWDPVLKQSFAGSGSAEHNHCGLQCELVGHNIARYFVRDGLRAFDLLASLPEVDQTRIAVTGNSGGGTQSSYLMLADERLACGLPCTFTTAREVYVPRTHMHDAEQNLDGAIPAGLDYDDCYACFAPRPSAIGAVTHDFFPIEGVRLAHERLQRLYEVYGAADRIALFEVESGHEYHPVLRQSAIEWFNRWLQPGAELREPGPLVPETEAAQRVTVTGQVCTSVPGARGVFDENAAEVLGSRATRHVPARDELAGLLNLPLTDHPLNPRVLLTAQEGDLTIEKGWIVPEADLAVPFLRLAGREPEAALMYCCDGGISAVGATDERLLRMLAAEGRAVYVVEPRGTGETTSRPLQVWDTTGRTTDQWLAEYTRMAGTSLAAQRAYDLSRALEYVRRREGEPPVALWAQGWVGWSAVLTAALTGGFAALCLEDLRPSAEALALEWTASIPQPYVIPGLLQLADVPELVAAAGADRLLLVAPRDALDRPLSSEAWQAGYAAHWAGLSLRPDVLIGATCVQRSAALAGFLGLPPS